MDDNYNGRKLQKSRYMPGLDGLRAIAVIAIIIYHLNPRWLPGGFLGVDTFFVISGFLITSLLLKEYNNNREIGLVNFWIRRLKRLVPAVFFMVASVVSYVLIFEAEIIRTIKEDGIAALVYLSNWWYIFEDVSYFEASEPRPFMHLWSLAIEEQFYIIWPVILLFMLRYMKKAKHIIWVTVGLTVASLLIMMLLAVPYEDNSRVYFGTDTRLQTLLLGAVLAYIWPPFRLKEDVNQKIKIWIDGIGIGALMILIILFITVDDSSHWIYYGGLYMITSVTLLLIASSVHPSTVLPKILGNPLFMWIGTRSYSLYLWHYPIIILINMNYVQGQVPLYVILVQVFLTILFAEVSFQWIETPFRKHGFKAIWPLAKDKMMLNARLAATLAISLITLTVMAGTFDHLHVDATKGESTQYLTQQEREDEGERSVKVNMEEISPLIIGDSIMVKVGEALQEEIPKAVIDAKVSRQMRDTINLVQEKYEGFDSEGDIIIIQLGTNGKFSEDELNELIEVFGEADIHFINTRVPRSWEGEVNEYLRSAGKRHYNVTVIDWYSRSEGHTEYFSSDGFHLLPEGVSAMTELIIEEIEK